MKEGQTKLITPAEIQKKKKDIERAASYSLTNEDIEGIIEAKKAITDTPANIAAEKIDLMREVDIARSQNDEVKYHQLQKKLAELEQLAEKIVKENENEQMSMLAGLNAKNRRRNLIEAREAELMAMNQKKMLGTSQLEYVDRQADTLKRRYSLFNTFPFDDYKSLDDVLDAFDLSKLVE